ncbi:FMN reductase [Halobacteriales archaeon QS_1_68_20]|nr:MAG: FMN reductase [Halobacteriales archaeon QS_1_68_20]
MTANVLAVGGSLGEHSFTRQALDRAVSAAGADAEQLDLREFDLPVYDSDRRNAGDADAFRARVRAADGVLLGTPVYHGTYSSALKAALDYCGFDEFEATPVGLLAVAGGRFPGATLAHLRETCRVLHADVLAHQVALPQAKNVISDGEFVDEEYADRVDELGRRVVQAARRRDAVAADAPTRG